MAGGPRPSFTALPAFALERAVGAVGPTGTSGVFVAHVPGRELCYLDFAGERGRCLPCARWRRPAVENGALHFCRAAGADPKDSHAATARGWLAETPRTWVCLSVPAPHEGDGAQEAEAVASVALPSDIAATCGDPEDAAVAITLASGSVRWFDAVTGVSAAKGVKVGEPRPGASVSLVRLGPGRLALLRSDPETPGSVEFFVLRLVAAEKRCELEHSGAVAGAPRGEKLGPWLGAAAAPSGAGAGQVLLCWAGGVGAEKPHCYTRAALLDSEAPQQVVPVHAPSVVRRPIAWTTVGNNLAEWRPAASKTKGSVLRLSLTDTEFGMPVASGDMPCPSGLGERVVTAGDVTLLLGQATEVLAVRWCLPTFTLQALIGTQVPKEVAARASGQQLAPLREAIAGKRSRSDPAVEELFSAKRRLVTDQALAKELQLRRWKPGPELVSLVVERQCWTAAKALLALPDLDEAFSAQLLDARPELLARVVKRAEAPQLLEAALRDGLDAKRLPGILETLLEWAAARKEFSEEALREAVPGLPTLQEIVAFLGALVDGCLPHLVALEGDLVDRVLDTLEVLHREEGRALQLYGTVRAACSYRPKRRVGEDDTMEIALLPL